MWTIKNNLFLVLILLVSCKQPDKKVTFKELVDEIPNLTLPLTINNFQDIKSLIKNDITWDTTLFGKNVIPVGVIRKRDFYTIMFAKASGEAFIATFDSIGSLQDSIDLYTKKIIRDGETLVFQSHEILNADTMHSNCYILNPKINPISDNPTDTLFITTARIITFAKRKE